MDGDTVGGIDVRIGWDDCDARRSAGEGDGDGDGDLEHIRDWQDSDPLAGNVEFMQYAYAEAHDGVERSTQHETPVAPPPPVPGTCDETEAIANSRYAMNLILYL